MLLEKHPCKGRKFLVGITLLSYFTLPCYQSLGATFSSEFNSLFPSNLDINSETFLEENKKNWQLVVKQIISSSDRFSSIDENSDIALEPSQQEEANQSLSVQTIVESLRQLRMGDNTSNGQVGYVPTLPQVSSANVYKGVYDFGSNETQSAQPVETFVFNARSSNISLPNRASVGGFSNPGFRSMGALGNASASNRTNVSGARGLVSLPQSQESSRSLIRVSSAPSFNAQLAMMPQNNVLGAMSRLDEKSNLNNVLNAMSSFGALKINVGFQTMPQMTMPSPLNLRDDIVKTSDLVRRNVQLFSPLRSEIQQQVAEQAYRQTQLQNQRQNDQYQRLMAQQRKQAEIQQKQIEKQRERQQKQLERYLERQRKMQENFQRQMMR